MAKPVDSENVFKTYDAADRNRGEDNIVLEDGRYADRSIEEQPGWM